MYKTNPQPKKVTSSMIATKCFFFSLFPLSYDDNITKYSIFSSLKSVFYSFFF